MPRETEIILRFGTRAALETVAAANGLLKGEPFLIDDEGRMGVALSTSTYQTTAKQSEASAAGGPSGTATITLPHYTGAVDWTETVAAPGVQAGMIIFAQFAAGDPADENEAWMLNPLHPPIAEALADQIRFTVQFAIAERGPIKINWKV